MLGWVRKTKEEAEEKKAPYGRGKSILLSSSSSSPFGLAPEKGTALTTHRRRISSSSSNYNGHIEHQPPSLTATTSTKERGSTTTSRPAGDSSSFLFLDVPFSSQWQCVVHDRWATPTLLKDTDLDAVAASAGDGGKRNGRQQQVVPKPKDVISRLLADDRKLRGMVLSVKI